MRLWILSDLHIDRRIRDIAVHPPEFDVLVCAGDMLTGDIAGSIEMTAAIARGKPAVFVAGNHEWMSAADLEEVLDEAHAAAQREGVYFLECDAADIGGIRFAGATLWTPDDLRFAPSVKALAALKPDVVIAHFEPPAALLIKSAARLWIYGHHHGFSDRTLGDRRLIRNGGHADETVDGEPARSGYTVEI
jgi:predicted phosphodiesterase